MARAIPFLAAVLLLAPTTPAAPSPRQASLPDLKPVITADFPDPSIIKVGNTWYAFGSQSAFDFKEVKVQVATSQDFKSWTLKQGHDALASLAPWVDVAASGTWAPSVSRRADGKFLMYYSAVTNTAGSGRFHCVGTAVSNAVEGPYHSNSDSPFACPTDQGGALDASAFVDPVDNTSYAVYKVDSNAIGHGGSCGNSVAPIVSTPIMIQQVEADGTTKIGAAVEVLTNSDLDGPLVEAPYLVRSQEGWYFLFFSSHCWTTSLYDVSYATSRSPLGPFTKTVTPLAVTGTRGMIGPGGASVAGDNGAFFVFHGYARKEDVGTRRAMYVAKVGYSDNNVLWQ